MKGLAHECCPPTSTGTELLQAIKNGQLPSGMTHWPSDPNPPPSAKRKEVDTEGITCNPKPGKRPVIPLGNAFAFSLDEPTRISTVESHAFSPSHQPSNIDELVQLRNEGENVCFPSISNNSGDVLVSPLNF